MARSVVGPATVFRVDVQHQAAEVRPGIALVGSLVVNQTSGLVTSAPDGLAQISTWLKDHYGVNLPTTSGQITKKLSDYAPVLAGGALGFATSLLGLIFQLFTVALLGFYFATDGPRVRRALCSALPPARQHEVLRVWDLANGKEVRQLQGVTQPCWSLSLSPKAPRPLPTPAKIATRLGVPEEEVVNMNRRLAARSLRLPGAK